MRTSKEINDKMHEIAKDHLGDPAAELVGNTLAWVQGEEIEPIELIKGFNESSGSDKG